MQKDINKILSLEEMAALLNMHQNGIVTMIAIKALEKLKSSKITLDK